MRTDKMGSGFFFGGGGEEVHWEFCYSEAAPFGIVPFLFQGRREGELGSSGSLHFHKYKGKGCHRKRKRRGNLVLSRLIDLSP